MLFPVIKIKSSEIFLILSYKKKIQQMYNTQFCQGPTDQTMGILCYL